MRKTRKVNTPIINIQRRTGKKYKSPIQKTHK